MVASVWLGPNSTTVLVESQEAAWETERLKKKVYHLKAEMKVLPLRALYSRMKPTMGLSPSNPGVQARENMLSLTSFNSTTGGSGGTKNEVNETICSFLSLTSQRKSMSCLTWGRPGRRVAVSPHCSSCHRRPGWGPFQVAGVCSSVYPCRRRSGHCLNLKHEKTQTLRTL